MTRAIFTALAKDLSANEHSCQEALKFNFKKQWYPLAVIEFLDKKKPHHVQLFGNDLVMWYDKTSDKWNVFEDACPHRLAPLSEGRIEEDGTLLCSYHGWRFDANGKCTLIPQANEKQAQALMSSKRACALSYPAMQAQGLLWVWGEQGGPGSDAAIESALKSPALIAELEDPELKGRAQQLTWSIRDMPYGWDFFMENVLDPAHVTVSHHGIVGNRYTSPSFFRMQTTRNATAQGGFAHSITFDKSPPLGEGSDTVQEFLPPSMVRIKSRFPNGCQSLLALYATPTKPGYVRHIGCQVLVKGEDGALAPGLGFFALPMPKWLNHVLASLFLHQDMVLLHHQEKILADAGYRNMQDKGVTFFRNWLRVFANGGVPWKAEGTSSMPPREFDKRKLFDVYNAHTKNCKVCQDAVQNLKLARGLFVGLSLASVALSHGVVALSSSLSCALVALALHKLIGLFYVYEFEHANND
ncbi:hypothetical protein GUITHDRAFT_159336 [Guillardia theta CCMP2712]|uniref:Rieske domain-containing protein n=1 Tax=Guillardia theta (strain CCMP2712) TaxID=905079 RepID=L1JSZ6_GUITC|nr:hypothetical protein GUITHDRAFT_159336 [Guillardia theta CCMP2712]EKX51208.1 hypothetical protein GUITHDRAFT_159336 [Guillardia theta CCMP2712]|eukprot:XP_005838188.1 hypothetical protein GUITHDRAFT_159336 [Guillardia theta CCMP2712]